MSNRQRKIKAFSMALILSLALNFAILPASALSSETRSLAQVNTALDVDGRIYMYLKGIANKNVSVHNRFDVSIGGTPLSVKGIELNGVAYLPFRTASILIPGSTYSYDSSTRTSTMRASGLEIIATDCNYVTYANGRALFNTTPCVILSDGRMYIPVSVFAKAVGMTVTTSGGSIRLTGSFKPLIHADKFYREDEVFWLARIIHAESRGEPLLGQIAVGSVVMNRVKSSYYPNTIYSVIFDRKYGVQFSPILDGSIYNTPGYTSTLAAKIALEGYDVTGGAFFFLAPELATSSWIPQTRKYAFTVGGHDFYF